MSETNTLPTKEELMVQLKDAIEVQKLQTELQVLRTQLVMSRFDEVKYTILFNEMTAPKQDESTAENKETPAN